MHSYMIAINQVQKFNPIIPFSFIPLSSSSFHLHFILFFFSFLTFFSFPSFLTYPFINLFPSTPFLLFPIPNFCIFSHFSLFPHFSFFLAFFSFFLFSSFLISFSPSLFSSLFSSSLFLSLLSFSLFPSLFSPSPSLFPSLFSPIPLPFSYLCVVPWVSWNVAWYPKVESSRAKVYVSKSRNKWFIGLNYVATKQYKWQVLYRFKCMWLQNNISEFVT